MSGPSVLHPAKCNCWTRPASLLSVCVLSLVFKSGKFKQNDQEYVKEVLIVYETIIAQYRYDCYNRNVTREEVVRYV